MSSYDHVISFSHTAHVCVYIYQARILTNAWNRSTLLPVLSGPLSLFSRPFSLSMARLVYAGNSIFSDMVFGAQMMRVPSYRRRFVSLYPTGRQLHRLGGLHRNWKVSFCSSARFIPLSPCKVRNPSTYPLSLFLVTSRCCT